MTDPLYFLLGCSLALQIGILLFLVIIWLRVDGDDGAEDV